MEPDTTAAVNALSVQLTWYWWDLAALVAALLAGAAGRVAGASQAMGGDLPAQKVIAPMSSIALAGYVAGVVANIMGHPLTDAELAAKGAILGTLAIGAWSAPKNAWQFLKAWRAQRRAKTSPPPGQ